MLSQLLQRLLRLHPLPHLVPVALQRQPRRLSWLLRLQQLVAVPRQPLRSRSSCSTRATTVQAPALALPRLMLARRACGLLWLLLPLRGGIVMINIVTMATTLLVDNIRMSSALSELMAILMLMIAAAATMLTLRARMKAKAKAKAL